MARVIIARWGEFTDGTIGSILTSFQARRELEGRRVWLAEQEQRIASAKLNMFVISERAAAFDHRVVTINQKEK